MNNDNFDKKLTRGLKAEDLVANYLIKKHDCTILQVKKVEGSEDYCGPVFENKNGKIVSPDFLVQTAKNKIIMVELKMKDAFSNHRISAEKMGKQWWVTCIDSRLWIDYCAVNDNIMPVCVLFLQLDGVSKNSIGGGPTGLYGQYVNVLKKKVNHIYKDKKYYWHVDSLKKLENLEDILQY